MIRAAQLRRQPESHREDRLREMHWWKAEPWPFLAPLIEARLSEANLREIWGHIAFLYEAAARFDAPSDTIQWAMNKPFGWLTLQEASEARKAFPEADRWAINSASGDEPLIAPPGDWSRPLQLNLRATWKEIEATLKPHLKREKKARGVRAWRREIPWSGLEAFDRRFAGLPTSLSKDADPKAEQRACQYWQESCT